MSMTLPTTEVRYYYYKPYTVISQAFVESCGVVVASQSGSRFVCRHPVAGGPDYYLYLCDMVEWPAEKLRQEIQRQKAEACAFTEMVWAELVAQGAGQPPGRLTCWLLRGWSVGVFLDGGFRVVLGPQDNPYRWVLDNPTHAELKRMLDNVK